jgi:hypothetical protein
MCCSGGARLVACDISGVGLTHMFCASGFSCMERGILWKREEDGEDGEDGESESYAQCERTDL